jgi:glycosyl transferase family 25
MERFKKDFASFPVPFIRVSAIEGKTLTFPIEGYDAFMFFWNMGRDASPGEIGCYLSHIRVLKMFLESGKEFALICEDDTMPTPECYEVVKQAIAHSNTWDLLRLYGGHVKTAFPYQTLTQVHRLCIPATSMLASVAYIVNRRTAEKLMQKLLPMTVPYDLALWYGRWDIREAAVFPNCILHEDYNNSTIRNATINDSMAMRKRFNFKFKGNWKPWHLVFWTSHGFRLRRKAVRCVLQIIRLLKQWSAQKKSARADGR